MYACMYLHLYIADALCPQFVFLVGSFFNTLKGCRRVFVQLGYLHFQFCLVMFFDRFLGFGNNLMHVYHFTTLSIVCLLAFLFSTVFYSVVFYDLLAFYRFLCKITCWFKICMNFSFTHNVNFSFHLDYNNFNNKHKDLNFIICTDFQFQDLCPFLAVCLRNDSRALCIF